MHFLLDFMWRKTPILYFNDKSEIKENMHLLEIDNCKFGAKTQ